MTKSNTKKVMAIASGGGHWVQLMRLQATFEGMDVFYVSIDPTSGSDVSGHRYYSIREATRKHKWGFAVVLMQLTRILIKERPDVIITTGAAPGMVALKLGRKFFGCKTIWIDSIANAEKLSTSAKLAAKDADLWLTQWPHLADSENGPKYLGAVL